ncbi:hypothetical protein ACN2WE_04895 [Streptomyces sp. cg28]|uniref:hypothetical protein n=1 Tax=Streptomyces sp. cg28 TaxID=3403457 RepID=UPI003B2259D8
MTLEFRPTGKPHCFDLFEEEEVIGEVAYTAPELDDDDPYWCVTIWSAMGTGREWHADWMESHEEAAEYAESLYRERVAERRELSKGARPPTISTPMGGQRRR